MKTSKQIAARIAAKKAMMAKELRQLDLSVEPGGMKVHLCNGMRGKTSEFTSWQRNNIRKTKDTKQASYEIS